MTDFKKYLPLVIALLGVVLIIGGIIYPKIKTEEPEVVVEKKDEILKQVQDDNKEVYVDVEGAVEKPGVYQIPYDSRIVDALIPAGGLSKMADRSAVSKSINLAQKVTDGMKIYIPSINDTNNANSSNLPSTSNLININMASSSELDTLPGIGTITAQKIIDNRPYQNISDLLTRKIVSTSVYTKIKDKLSVY